MPNSLNGHEGQGYCKIVNIYNIHHEHANKIDIFSSRPFRNIQTKF